ncbi:MAG: hypothetical protein ACYDCS_07725 [Candidatus Dormibacteria bacterium]
MSVHRSLDACHEHAISGTDLDFTVGGRQEDVLGSVRSSANPITQFGVFDQVSE